LGIFKPGFLEGTSDEQGAQYDNASWQQHGSTERKHFSDESRHDRTSLEHALCIGHAQILLLPNIK
jgi:outer membrane protease